MSGRWCVFVAAWMCVAGVASAQQQRPALEVAPGAQRAFHVAVQRFSETGLPIDRTTGQRAGELRDRIEAALGFDGVLLPIASEAFLGEVQTQALAEGFRSDCADWTQSGADALVEGAISSRGGRIAVEFAVWDTARCVRLDRQKLSRTRTSAGLLAREIADQIVAAFTGSRGAAATEIAFISNRTGHKELFVMGADGSHARPATRSHSIKAFPEWFPGGEAILYTAYRGGDQPTLYVSSRGQVPPGPFLPRLFPHRPKYRGVFDPSGDSLAVVASIDGDTEIFLARRDGGHPVRLTRNRAIDVSPAWSPDGDQIAFVSDRSGSPQIYVMDRKGRNLRRVTFQGTYNTSPAWSPDGRWIAYETRLVGQFDIWLIDPAGEVNVPLITHRRTDESPSWSPDGRKIAFSSTRRGRSDIYVIDANGENLRRLTRDAGENTAPTWGPFVRPGPRRRGE